MAAAPLRSSRSTAVATSTRAPSHRRSRKDPEAADRSRSPDWAAAVSASSLFSEPSQFPSVAAARCRAVRPRFPSPSLHRVVPRRRALSQQRRWEGNTKGRTDHTNWRSRSTWAIEGWPSLPAACADVLQIVDCCGSSRPQGGDARVVAVSEVAMEGVGRWGGKYGGVVN